MSKAKDRAWIKRYWETVGRERRRERAAHKRADDELTASLRAAVKASKQAEYRERAKAKLANEQPVEKHHEPSTMVPLAMRKELEAEKVKRAWRLEYLSQERWPLSALKASRLARLSRHTL